MQASIGDEPAAESVDVIVPDLTNSLYAIVAFFAKEAAVGLFDAVDALDLTVTQIRVLHHLDEMNSELTVKEAAEFAVMSVGAISRSLDGLVRRDFIQRREDGVDRRMKRIKITDEGRGAIRRFEAVNKTVIERIVESLPSDQRDQLSEALACLVARPEIAACRPPGA